jgi:hypothetical protein
MIPEGGEVSRDLLAKIRISQGLHYVYLLEVFDVVFRMRDLLLVRLDSTLIGGILKAKLMPEEEVVLTSLLGEYQVFFVTSRWVIFRFFKIFDC